MQTELKMLTRQRYEKTLRNLLWTTGYLKAMLELQNIMKLKNTSDWGMMSMSLKSLSRRYSRKASGTEIPDYQAILNEVSAAGMLMYNTVDTI